MAAKAQRVRSGMKQMAKEKTNIMARQRRAASSSSVARRGIASKQLAKAERRCGESGISGSGSGKRQQRKNGGK